MAFVGWILFAVLLFFYLGGQRISQRKRLALTSYAILLLMEDEVTSDHRKKIKQWIPESGAKDAMELGLKASNAIEQMADGLLGTSLLGSNAALWNSEEASNLRTKP